VSFSLSGTARTAARACLPLPIPLFYLFGEEPGGTYRRQRAITTTFLERRSQRQRLRRRRSFYARVTLSRNDALLLPGCARLITGLDIANVAYLRCTLLPHFVVGNGLLFSRRFYSPLRACVCSISSRYIALRARLRFIMGEPGRRRRRATLTALARLLLVLALIERRQLKRGGAALTPLALCST